jgi:hypothetical protein
MPFDFDTTENQEEVPEQPTKHEGRLARQQEVVDEEQFVNQFYDDSAIDEQMSAVERRLEKALYYRVLINQELFNEASDVGNEVQAEIRDFVRIRMAVLVGAVAEKTTQPVAPVQPPQFTEDEAQVLREIARKLKKHPLKETPSAPEVKPAPAVATGPAVKPMAPPKSKPGPKAPAKPLAKSNPGTRKPAKVTAANQSITIVEPDGSKKIYQKMLDSERGEFYTDGSGRKFTLGINEAGKQFMRVVDGQARPVGVAPLPMANEMQYHAAATQHAQAVVSKSDPLIGALINKTLTS